MRITAPPDGGCQAGSVTDPLVEGSQDQEMDEFSGDKSVGDSGLAATPGEMIFNRWDEVLELAPWRAGEP